MSQGPRCSVVALVALCCTAALAACSATRPGSPAGALVQQPGRTHAVEGSRLGHALVAFNSDTGALEFWPLEPGGGQTPQVLSMPIGAFVTGMAADGQTIAMAAENPAGVIVFQIPTQRKRTLSDPFGTPIDVAIDKNEDLFVANVASPNGNITMYPPRSGRAVELDCRWIGLPEAVAVDDEGDIFVNGYQRRTGVAGVVEIPTGPGGPEPQNCVRLALNAEPGYVAGIAIDPKTDDLIVLDNPDLCAGGIEGRMTVYPKPYEKATGVAHDLGANCAGLMRISADSSRVFVLDEDVSASFTFVLQRSFPDGSNMGEYDNGYPDGFTTIPNVLPN